MIETTTLALIWLLICLCVVWYDHRVNVRLIQAQRRNIRLNKQTTALHFEVMKNLARKYNHEKENREYLEQLLEEHV